jgi:metal-responsive CopG/Arc/MetJ family transcriptional regulator
MTKGKITLYLDVDDVVSLQHIAKNDDTSPSRIVRHLIRTYIAQFKEQRKNAKTI